MAEHGVVPNAAIVPVFPAGTYTTYDYLRKHKIFLVLGYGAARAMNVADKKCHHTPVVGLISSRSLNMFSLARSFDAAISSRVGNIKRKCVLVFCLFMTNVPPRS